MLWFMKKDNFLNKKFYKFFYDYSTRWNDNDIYGHVNNIHYYSFFDSAINKYLIEFGELNIENDPVVGYIVNSSCNYVSPIKYPVPAVFKDNPVIAPFVVVVSTVNEDPVPPVVATLVPLLNLQHH